MKLRTVAGLLMALTITGSAFAQGQKKLSVGDPAPGMDIEKWVKNSETKIEDGKVYLVEFWATWCGPCIRAMPHLSALQREFADELTVIAVSSEEVGKVSAFVKKQGSKMDMTVAVDRSNATNRAWFDAAGLTGIPASFIVDRKGKIAYIGNPHSDDFEPTLRQVISGRFDPKLQNQASPALKQARDARKVRNWRLASMHFDEVLVLDPGIFANAGLENYEMMLVDMDSKDAANTYARNELMNKHFASDAGALQQLAEKIAADPKIDASKRDMDLALEAAQAARRLAGDTNPQALATEANIRYLRGETAQAVDLQKQAYFNASPKKKPEYKRMLTTYQEAGERAAMSSSRKP
jgi:thiol-disulfide isomerase/thioredoxin